MRTDFHPGNVELWICNWCRPAAVNQTVRNWLESWPFTRANVIANHSSITLKTFDFDLQPRIKLWPNVLRPDCAVGSLSQIWNACYLHTFLQGKRYALCSQDDILVQAGWLQLIENSNYDAYFAPQGDRVHLITREAVRKIGWWDERFATIGYHELDFMVRLRQTDVLCVIEDGHCDGYLQINPIGLSAYWQDAGVHRDNYAENNKGLWREKWGSKPCDASNLTATKLLREIDWYPWFKL